MSDTAITVIRPEPLIWLASSLPGTVNVMTGFADPQQDTGTPIPRIGNSTCVYPLAMFRPAAKQPQVSV